MSEMIFNCPHCDAPVQCDCQYAGQTVACPHCQGGIIVPAAAELEVPAVEPTAPPAETPAETPAEAPIEQPIEPSAEVAEPQPTVGVPAEVAVEIPATEPPVEAPAGEPVEALAGEPLIEFPCPHCGVQLDIPESAIGEAVACPDCLTEVTNAFPRPKPSSGKKKVIMKKMIKPAAGR